MATWPAPFVERTPDGWVLRATPGLHGRGRSNHALVPTRPLSAEEIDLGISRAVRFAQTHGSDCGIQVGPMEAHAPLLGEIEARGWEIKPPTLVMTAAVDAIVANGGSDVDDGLDFQLELTDHLTPDWFAAWRACDPERDNADGHIDTVFKLMDGAARFAHCDDRAVGIVAELDGLAGLYCLAVHPAHRRCGIGTKLVRGLLADSPAETVYLQVFGGNEAGLGLYNSLGFTEAYRYCHCIAPAGVA